MTGLTDLQRRCLRELKQLVDKPDGLKTTHVRHVAQKIGKTRSQTYDCLNRLRNKGLVLQAGFGFWALTVDGYHFPTGDPDPLKRTK